MKKILTLLTLIYLIKSPCVFAEHIKRKGYVANEIIIKYKSHVSSLSQKNSIEKIGALQVKKLMQSGLSKIKISNDKDLQTSINDLRQDPEVEFAQPNYIYSISNSPNDPFYSKEWGLKNTGQTVTNAGLGGPDFQLITNNPGTSGFDMRMEKAWDTITDCSSTIVAVLDTGINYNHQDLSSNMWDGGVSYPKHGYDFITSTNDPMDRNGHGTHVAGTIGAIGNNGIGSTGVCWKVKLMAIRVLDASGNGTSDSIINGIDFARTHGAKVINLSLGGDSYDALENDAIVRAKNSGVLVVAAAGNDGADVDSTSTPNPVYPCQFNQENILCIAALDQKYTLADFSNYGANSVDVAAPGVNIVSPWPGTHTTINESLASTSPWNISGSWGYKSLNFGTNVNTLVSPSNYNHSNSTSYSNNADNRIWKSFNLSGATTAILDFYIMWDTEADADFVRARASTSTGDPTASGALLEQFTGSSDGSREGRSYDISNYISANTTIGFNLTSNATNVSYGTNISNFSITSLVLNNSTYNVISGTSMATPNVSGVAAMLFAFNPNFGYQQVINAIKNGGDSYAWLAGKTSTGKAVNAANALSYINAPTGGAAVKLP